MLLAQARMSEEGMKLLCDFVRAPSEETGSLLKQAEKDADELRRPAHRRAEPDAHHTV